MTHLQRFTLGCVAGGLLSVAAAVPAWATADHSTGGAFLHLGHGARAHALGGGGAALLRDDAAVYWNPANLTWLTVQTSLTLMYADVLPAIDDGYGTASVALGFGDRLGTSDQPLRPSRGAYGAFLSHIGFQFDSGDAWSENVLQFALAFAPNNFTSLGIGLKFLGATNDFESAGGRGAGVDLGLSVLVTERLMLALVGRDAWTRIRWETSKWETQTRSWTLAADFRLWRGMHAIADATLRRSVFDRVVAGVEWAGFDELLWLRGALTHLRPGEARTWPSAGFGVRVQRLAVDYGVSFDDADSFDVGHRVSVQFGF